MLKQVLSVHEGTSMNHKLTFLIPSMLGLALFMFPIEYQGHLTICIAMMAKILQASLTEYLDFIVMSVIVFMAASSVVTRFFQPAWLKKNDFLYGLFFPTTPWFVVRLLGGVFAWMTYYQIGPEMVWSDITGGLLLNDLLLTLFCVFCFAGFFMPLLLNFGLLELAGIPLTKVMRKVFNLPGRSAVDCLTSWIGDGSVAVLLTSKQYEQKRYTQREAAVIGTSFSVVSLTFTLVVLSQVKLEAMFAPFYITICLAGLIAAIVVPKLPPLSWKKDVYIDGSARHAEDEIIPKEHTVFSFALESAIRRASEVKSVSEVCIAGMKNVLDMILGVLPVVMAIGTMATILAEYTLLFDYLGKPFVPLLELLGIPEAVAASKTVLIGFADMFIPSILAASIQSDMTRFIIAGLSVTQLIYLSEIGALLLGSKIPLSVWELMAIFLLRTLVCLLVITGAAHVIF